MSWKIVVMVVFGAIGVALALLVRAGKSRSFYAIYQTEAPPWVRNRSLSCFRAGSF
jgi:hypothetical protein